MPSDWNIMPNQTHIWCCVCNRKELYRGTHWDCKVGVGKEAAYTCPECMAELGPDYRRCKQCLKPFNPENDTDVCSIKCLRQWNRQQ